MWQCSWLMHASGSAWILSCSLSVSRAMRCSVADLKSSLPAEAKARGGLSEAEAAVLKAARAKSLGASKEAVAINAAWKGAALLLMQLLPVPAEVHMRLAAGEVAIFTVYVLCRAVLPLSGAGSRGSRSQSLHHSRLPCWMGDVSYRPVSRLRLHCVVTS